MSKHNRHASPAHLLDKALMHHQSGRLKEAQEIYARILREHPGQPDALHLMGVIAHQVGQHNVAVNLIGEAIKVKPAVAAFHNNIAEAYRALANHEKARFHYEKAIEFKKDYFEAYNNLGITLQEGGQFTEAIARYEEALVINPLYAEAHNNIAIALKELGRFDEALVHAQQATKTQPDYAEAYNTTGIILHKLSLTDEAIDSYKKAIEIKPDYAEAYNNLAITVREKGRYQEELDLYEKALSFNPQYAEAYFNLGSALQEHGYLDEAMSAYGKAYELKPDNSVKLKAAFLLPAIPASTEDIARFRTRFADNLEELTRSGISLTHPETQVETTSFYLAYHGFDNKDILAKLAQFYTQACPSLLYTAPYCLQDKPGKREGKTRIGFVSKYFRDHTVGRYMKGIVNNLSRQDFEVLLFTFPGKQDAISQAIENAADKVITLPPSLETARRYIENENPDVLFYPDIGMERFTYFLAFSRLAPVQCAFYGHPDTTGVPTIDYYISHDGCETPGSDRYYSEKLLKLPGSVTYTYFYKPAISGPPKGRPEFGLGEADHIYICPQALFKIHPDFDLTLGDILRSDPRGVLILFQGESPRWAQLLSARFQNNISDVADRIILAPRMAYNDYLSLVSISDVMLDTFHFNGGNTTFDSFAMGTPVVTLPGSFMRGRQALGLYKRMGITDCIAANAAQYTEIALRLAHNRDFHDSVRETILTRNNIIFEDIGMVKELEKLLLRIGPSPL